MEDKLIQYTGNRKFTTRNIRWKIIKHCNYACSYCSSSSYLEKYQICTNYKDIIDYLNKYNLGYVRLYGGEPTLHPNFFELVSLFKNKIGMYTNLSRSMSFFKELIKIDKFKAITASFHYNGIEDIDEFLEKVDFLRKFITVYVNVLLENENTDDIIKYFNYFKSLDNCVVNLSRVMGNPHYYEGIDISKYNNDNYLNYAQYVDVKHNNETKRISEYEFQDRPYNMYNYICDMRKYYFSLDIYGNFSDFCSNGFITNVYENTPSKLRAKNIICKYPNACLMCYLMIGNKTKFI